jgi:hypothetical protein
VSYLSALSEVGSEEHLQQGERALSKEGHRECCGARLEFSSVQSDESRGTCVDTGLGAY